MSEPVVYPGNERFYTKENRQYIAPYVKRLIDEGMPLWMVDIERCDFRTAHDTGANMNALIIWNSVRKAHGFDRLTIDDLWERHREDKNWTQEYVEYSKKWWAGWDSKAQMTTYTEEFKGEIYGPCGEATNGRLDV